MLSVLLRVKGKLIAVHFCPLLVGREARIVQMSTDFSAPGAGRETRDLRTGLSRPNRPEMRGPAYILGHRFGEPSRSPTRRIQEPANCRSQLVQITDFHSPAHVGESCFGEPNPRA
jgi:hypothetical protein